MTVKLDLKPSLHDKVRDVATRRGLSIERYLVDVIEEAVPDQEPETGVELLDRWLREDATDSETEQTARREEWEDFTAQVDANRSSNRKLFT